MPSLHVDGVNDVIGEFSAGEFFADLSIVNGTNASADVIALSDIVVCMVLYREDYEVLKLSHPELPQMLKSTARKRSYERLSPFLKRPAFFVGLGVDLTRAIISQLENHTYQPGELLLRRGRPTYNLIFILRGE